MPAQAKMGVHDLNLMATKMHGSPYGAARLKSGKWPDAGKRAALHHVRGTRGKNSVAVGFLHHAIGGMKMMSHAKSARDDFRLIDAA